jgi:hypothetical protein
MPSLWHDSALEFFTEDPELVGDLLRCAGKHLPEDVQLLLAPTNETDRMLSKDLDSDMVVVLGSAQYPSHVIIVELQRAEDAAKLRQWPRYAAAKWLRYECPVDVLVICPDEKTADWFARPIQTDLDGYTHCPTVLRSVQVPAFTVGMHASLNPGMGVLSLAYHGTNEQVVSAFAAGILSLPPAAAQKYYEYGLGMSSDVVRNALEQLMATRYPQRFSKLGLRYREEGLIEGERGTVRMVLKARGLELSEANRERLDHCTSLDTLKRWSQAALTAGTADEVFS